MARYDQCDETCTTDCGHCKGQGKPRDRYAEQQGWRRMDDDGQPYISYYDAETNHSFIWDGKGTTVQVCREAGEPIIDTFELPAGFPIAEAPVISILNLFPGYCRHYLAVRFV